MDDDRERLRELNLSLTNWTPGPDAMDAIEDIRDTGKILGSELIGAVDDSREREIALTHLEEAIMWGVKAIVLADRQEALAREELPDV